MWAHIGIFLASDWSRAFGNDVMGTGSHVFLGGETAEQLEKRIVGSGSHVIWKEKPLTSWKNGSWAQDRAKPRRKRGLKVQSPIFGTGVGIKG